MHSVKSLDTPALNTSQISDTLALFSGAPSTDHATTDRLISDNSVAEVFCIPEAQVPLAYFNTLSSGGAPEVFNTQTDEISDGDESHTEEESAEFQKDSVPLPATNGVSKHGQWTHLEELLDRLLFIAISEDGLSSSRVVNAPANSYLADSSFIANFLLTYRRFATPRSVLLAMQKRIRQLDNPSGDPMFACFAQMR